VTVYIIPVNCVHFVGNVIVGILSTNTRITDRMKLHSIYFNACVLGGNKSK
jgi:hypothetical protein